MQCRTYSLDQVAGLLRREPQTFARKWRGLAREHGFPAPLPGCGLVWPAALVDAWIMTGGAPVASAPANDREARFAVSHQAMLDRHFGHVRG